MGGFCNLFALVCLLCSVLRSFESTFPHNSEDDYFPKVIRSYRVRNDVVTRKPVTRGRLELLGGLLDNKQYPLEEFKKALQCAPTEPDLEWQRGTISLMKMIPPVADTFQIICAWAETHCSDWSDCRKHAKTLKNKAFMKDRPGSLSGFQHMRLLRITQGKLYLDWPWARQRLDSDSPINIVLEALTRKVSNLQDVAFFMGGEQYALPYNYPVPLFSHASSFKSADIPWPWDEQFVDESKLHLQGVSRNNTFSGSTYSDGHTKHKPWVERKDKLGYFGDLHSIRSIFFQQAALRPDLIEATWTEGPWDIRPENPLSTEPAFDQHVFPPNATIYLTHKIDHPAHSNEAGYLKNLYKVKGPKKKYNPGDFKYLAVLQGYEGFSLSGRLGSFLAHSGAVVLLQHSEFNYHFSSRLKPWVHYVPLSYSAADVVEKIEWLKTHDKEAQQIVANARNFGLSYLRLEDMMCYAATALDTLGTMQKDSDVLAPFNPKLFSELPKH